VNGNGDNLWADALGIDLEELSHEHPNHPDQLRLKRIITKKSESYWARERFLARLEDSAKTVMPHTITQPEKIRKKRAKVGRYEFTERQIQIARAVLDAHNPL
jgi:metal-dependent hydrolase (beta-lactamase superfamily II)